MERTIKLCLALSLLFTIFINPIGSYGQLNCPNGFDSPSPPGPTSCEAVSFCNGEINGYCGQLGFQNITWPGSLCNGTGVPNNMEWLAFVAAYTTITITVTPANCPGVPGGFQGIQAGIYDDCETGPGVQVPGACQTACSTGPINLTSNNFIVGNVYYLFIDGCAGDMCQYGITTTPADATAIPDLVNPIALAGPTTMCAGATGITYSIPEVFQAIDYIWTVPAGWTVSQGNPGNEITIDFPSGTSSGQICVVAENDCHDTDPLCITVNVAPIPITPDPVYYCQGETYVYPSDGANYTQGNYVITLAGASLYGCDSTVNLIVTENPDVFFDIEIALCQGESYDVCGIPYDIPGGFDIDCGPNFQGCDSTISLSMIVLEPLSDIIPPGILGCGINESIYLDGFSSFGDSFEWTTVDGDICDDPTSLFVQVCLPGTYCLTSTMEYATPTQGTVTCTDQQCVLVTSNSEPPMTTQASTDIACNGETNGTATVTVNNAGIGPFTYDWNPNVSVSNTASGLSGGTYTVIVTASGNGCTSIESITINEPTVIGLSTTQTNASCDGGTNGSASVVATGGTPGYSYLWCDGQTTVDATNLPIGQCCVVVTDASSCTEEICVTITDPAAMTASTSQVNVDCFGASTGSATVTAGGGTPGYTYLWCDSQTGAMATGLPAGPCCVVVTDLNGCTIESCVDLTEPAGMTLTSSQTNVSCAGGNDGMATVNPTGGAGGYTYLWCNAQTTQTATDLTAIACDVVVTDANGCTSSISVTPTEPVAITLTTTQTNVNCIGGSDGTATANPGGGAGGFTYMWCDGQTTQTANGLSIVPCNVVVTDMNGCTQQTTVTLTQPSSAISITGTSTEAACGNNDGTISIDVLGGTPGYTYAWSPSGGSVEDPTGLGPGTYTVVVTDLNSCTQTFSIDVSTPSGLTLTNTPTDASCSGGVDGSIDLEVTGGVGMLTYQWDNGAGTGQDPTGLSANTYNVTVTDGAGCTFVSSAIIDEPAPLTTSGSSTQATCGDANGTISTTVAGGTGPYNYFWTPGGSVDPNPTGLGPDNYSVLVTDANGCTSTAMVEVTTPVALALVITPTDANCNGATDGSIELEVSGGNPGYTYAWTGTGSNSEDPVGLAAGNYEVTVTDADNCTEVISTVIAEPTALDISFTTTETTCGDDNGTASVTVMGGTAPYSYAWNNGGGGDTPNPTDLEAINYEVTITDDLGCTQIQSIDIGEIAPMELAITPTDASCNNGADGSIDLEVTNGTGPYTYVWTNTASIDQDPTGLAANNYEVVVTDANGCTEIIDIDIDEPNEIEINGSSQDAVCGDDNGAISLNVNGGAGGFTYLWSPAGDTVEDPTDLAPGTYTVVVTDMNNCSQNFTIDVETPTGLSLSATPEATECNGAATGSIDLVVLGGTGPFEYEWDNGETTQDITGLAGGEYCVIVTDDTDCTIVLCETIVEPTEIVVDAIATDATCGDANGTITSSVIGGSGVYTYLWSPGGSVDANPSGLLEGDYSVVVTDANGCTGTFDVEVETPIELTTSAIGSNVSCNGGADGSIDLTVNGGVGPYEYDWSEGSIVEDPTGLSVGTITCIVTDANGCTSEISVDLDEPTVINIDGLSTDETCGDANGTISTTVDGGTGPYTYLWTPGGSVAPNPTGLTAGDYTVEVTDVNGCTNTSMVSVLAPNALVGTTASFAASCNGGADGSAVTDIQGGTQPYTYAWSPGGSVAPNPTGLAAGDYTVIVTDADGCSIELQETIIEPTPIAIDGTTTDETCGDVNGTISTIVDGGTGPYTYIWTPGGSVLPNPTGLAAGDYTVEVTDANGCSDSYAITINTPAVLESSAEGQNVSCFGGNDGAADITVIGGTTPYTYEWSNGSTLEDPTDFEAGAVTGTVTDANGCTSDVTLVLDEPEALGVTSTETDETCGELNGTISLTVVGGTAPFNYNWTQGMGDTPTPTGLAAGGYDVIITDANGCTIPYATAVSTPNELILSADVTDANCNSDINGFIDLTITGGVAPFTQIWSPGGWTGEDLADIPAGDYTVIVTDATDCSVSLMQTVTEPTVIEIDGTSTEALCNQSNGTIDINVEGGTGAYTYVWSPAGGVVEDPTGLGIGNYTVVVTDDNGCTGTFEIGVETPSGLALTPTAIAANCNGASDGAVNLVVNGGTAPFTYLWMPNGEVTPELQGVPAGTYDVLVTDDDGCTIVASAIVNEPDLVVVTGNPTDETCNLSNGTITTAVIGGTGPYTYAWSPSGSTDPSPVGLAAMVHTVVVTDANGCTGTNAITVDAPNAIVGDLTPTNISCDNGSDGSITANISGGVGPYTYAWSPTGDTGETASGLQVGNYTVVVTDANDCTFTLSQELTAPGAIEILSTSTEATCGETNGSITLTVSGGSGAYNYEWIPALPNVPDPGNLGAGNYTCIVTDANDCSETVDVAVQTPTMLNVSTTSLDATCNGGANGSIDLTVSGGVSPFTYAWSNGFMGEDPSGLAAGVYTVDVLDATGCLIVASGTIDEPTAIAVIDINTPATCNENNGTADITVSGGTSPYTFAWSTGSVIEDPTDFGAGSHIVTVTDANGCTGTHGVEIDSPGQPDVMIAFNDVNCFGGSDGSIDVTITGGISPFIFSWNTGATTEDLVGVPAGSYTLEVIDANNCVYNYAEDVGQPDELVASTLGPSSVNCNGGSDASINLDVIGGTAPYSFDWDNGAPDVQNPSGLSAGPYNVIVTDANGCTAVESISITEPLALSLTAIPTMTNCNGSSDGSIDLSVSGGVGSYTYTWSNASTDEDPTGLSAGNYIVVVTDDNGCTETTNVQVNQPEPVLVNISSVSEYGSFNTSCASSEDGTAEASATGGLAPFSYQWDNGATGAEVDGLGVGTYNVIATDANGCTGTTEVILEGPEAVVATASVIDVSCYGENDGAVIVEGTEGGNGPYVYSLDGGDFNPNGLFANLVGGSYDLTVQDANGCEETQTLSIIQPEELVVYLGDDIEIQLGQSVDITAELNVDTSMLQQWSWTQGHSFVDSCDLCLEREIYPFESGVYEFLAIDDNGCVDVEQISVLVIKDRPVYIPNAFSPNGDGINDFFQIYLGAGASNVKTFRVFNRWGEIVYELSDFFLMAPEDGWDGKFNNELMNPAVFVYVAEVVFLDGHVEIYKGDVSLVR